MEQNISLANLLNDESFIRWLKGKSSVSEDAQWNRWAEKDPKHRILVNKAQKFISMPFKKWNDQSDMKEQLKELEKSLKKSVDLKFLKFENKD